jgi:hypothetical protein
VTWFPDGEKLLVGVVAGTTTIDLHVVPVDGSPSRALEVHGWGAAVAHDGKHLATFDEDGIRLASIEGGPTRVLVGSRENAEFATPTWSPDDRWIAYSLTGRDLPPRIRAVAADGSADVVLVEDPQIVPSRGGMPTYTWLPDGHLVYVHHDGEGGASFRAVPIDLSTGRARGDAVTLATYADEPSVGNASRDGELLYSRTQILVNGYRGVDRNGSLEVRIDARPGWQLVGVVDGTDYYLSRASNDRTELLAVRDGAPRVIASLEDPVRQATLSPDATALLYGHPDADSGRISLQRVDLASGATTLVEQLPYTDGLFWAFACTSLCVVGAVEGPEQVFHEVDPIRGRTRRIGSVHGPGPWAWDVSADGASLLVAHGRDAVRIVDVATGGVRNAVADPQMLVRLALWIGDGPAFFLAGAIGSESQVVRWDADGASTRVWSSTAEAIGRLRSFDRGASVYLWTTSVRRDYWLLEPR